MSIDERGVKRRSETKMRISFHLWEGCKIVSKKELKPYFFRKPYCLQYYKYMEITFFFFFKKTWAKSSFPPPGWINEPSFDRHQTPGHYCRFGDGEMVPFVGWIFTMWVGGDGFFLPKTNSNSEFIPENGWLEASFLLGWLPGRCERLVSEGVNSCPLTRPHHLSQVAAACPCNWAACLANAWNVCIKPPA